jgi:hypothetical protein
VIDGWIVKVLWYLKAGDAVELPGGLCGPGGLLQFEEGVGEEAGGDEDEKFHD